MPRGLLLSAGFLAMLAGSQPQAIIEGKILDAAGSPLADAGVALIRPPILTLAQSTSSADGTFRLEVSDTGAAQLQFFAPGRGYFYLPILVDLALHATLEVRLAAPDDSFASQVTALRPASVSARLLAVMADAVSEQSRYQFWSRRGIDSAGYDWKPAVAKAAKQLGKERAPLVRQALYLELLRFRRLGAPLSESRRSRALREVPPTATIWALEPNMASLAGEPCRPDKPIAPCLNYFSDAATSHPDTLVQQWMLVEAMNLSMTTGDSAQAEDFLQRLEQEHPESPLLGFARGILQPRPGASIGGSLPDLRVSALEDSSVVFDNESLLGKTVLIDVWATWCDSCLAELPGLLHAYRVYHDRGFEVLGVSFDDDRQLARDFGRRLKIPWLEAFAEGNFESSVAKTLGITTLPRRFLVDSAGAIVAIDSALFGRNLIPTLEKILGQTR
ncbi:MAG TPA: thioredoxin-like domain-containing protein [Gemmatimonadales bacterium]|nr:thioredoxin-like domain-containing protein [Gemmatimonadales bacterium]